MFDSDHSDEIQCTGPSSLVDREDRLMSKLLLSGTKRQKTSKYNLSQTVALFRLYKARISTTAFVLVYEASVLHVPSQFVQKD